MAFLKSLGISLVSGHEGSHGLPVGLDGSSSLHAVDLTPENASARKTGLDDAAEQHGHDQTDSDINRLTGLDFYLSIGDEFSELRVDHVDEDGDVIMKQVDDPDAVPCARTHLSDHTCPGENLDTSRKDQSFLLFSLLKLLPPGPAKPGYFVVHDKWMVSLWTTSGVIGTPFLAPPGTQEGTYFF
jgi:hypothetical protein